MSRYKTAEARERALALTRHWRAGHREHIRRYRVRWDAAHADRVRAMAKETRRRREARGPVSTLFGVGKRMFFRALADAAMANGCVDCGNKNLSLLDLDHVRGTKRGDVSRLVYLNCSREDFTAEIDKCETRCANCHRLKTIERQHRRPLTAWRSP